MARIKSQGGALVAGSKRSVADETRGTDFLPNGLVLASRGLQAPIKAFNKGKMTKGRLLVIVYFRFMRVSISRLIKINGLKTIEI